MGIFGGQPAWMTDDTNKLHKGLKSIEKCYSPKKLKEAALNAPRHEIRVAAMNRLTDQTILADLAKNAPLPDIRRQAAVKLTDQAVIADIAEHDENLVVRTAATENLTDQVALGRIARNEKDKKLILLVIKKLTDQESLTYLVKNEHDWKIRFKAAKKLDDRVLAQEIYAQIVRYEDLDDGKRKRIVKQLTDQSALAYVAKLPTTLSKDIWVIRKMALEKITDASILSDVVQNAEEESVRQAASEQLKPL
ncbi:MAG: hypothetical protein FWG33_04590 [Oscillospiraceae bacterium]|nr:hypothetical protein [Oscillospiraceae bacterium]